MCDPYYCMYSYIRGYCVRLNSKFESENLKTYELLKITKPENEMILFVNFLDIVDKYEKKYRKTININ